MRAHRNQLAYSGLATGVTLTILVVIVAAQPASLPTADPNLDSEGKPLRGTTIPCAPIAEKRHELGCYVAARQRLGALPQGTPLSWHLDAFPTRAAAEADKGPLGVVTEAFGRTWLFTSAPAEWRAAAGAEHVATVGPLPLGKMAPEYTAVYLATTFRPRPVQLRPRALWTRGVVHPEWRTMPRDAGRSALGTSQPRGDGAW